MIILKVKGIIDQQSGVTLFGAEDFFYLDK